MSLNRTVSQRCLVVLVFLAILCLASPAAFAAPPCTNGTDAWVGSGADANWSTVNNWNNGTSQNRPPCNGDSISFVSPITARPSNSNDNNTSIANLSFAAGGYTVADGGKGTLTITGNVSATNATGINSITEALLVGSSSPTWTTASGSTLIFANLDLNSNALNLTANGTIKVTGAISDTGGGALAITKTGNGALRLTGTSTYAGATNINAGSLTGNGTLTNSTVTIANGASIAPDNSGSPSTFTLNNLTISAGGIVGIDLNGIVAGTSYDVIAATGNIDLTNWTTTSGITVGFTPALNQTFAIMTAVGTITPPASGPLMNGLSFNAGGKNFTINYTANTVTLTNNTPPPPTFTWVGSTLTGGFALWSTNGNWLDGAAANNAPPISSTTTSQLFFDNTGANKTVSQDDFGTTPNFDSITLSTSGYSLVHAGAAINGIGGGINATNAAGSNSVDILMQLSANQSWTQAAGGTLNVINNFNVNGKTLSFPGGGIVNLASSGSISGATGALNVNGTGTVTVNGTANSFAGTASVSAGKLVIASNLNSAVSVTGGTLQGTAQASSINASSGNGVIESGSGTGTGTLTSAGATILSSTASLQAGLSANGVSGKLATNSLTLGSAALVINDLYGASAGHAWTIASSSSAINGQLTNGGLAIASGVKFTQGGSAYHLTYTGGSGNDIVLTSDGANTAPSINTGSTTITASAAEGATVTLSVNFTDPDTETHSVVVDWGDTASSPLSTAALLALTPCNTHVSASGTQTTTCTHVYADNKLSGVAAPKSTASSFTVKYAVVDSGNAYDIKSTSTSISNATPSSITITPASSTVNEGSQASIDVAFKDGCTGIGASIGCTDDHSLDINWGDGTSHTVVGTVVGGSGTGVGAGITSGGSLAGITHTYQNNTVGTSSSNYTITAKVTDEDTANASNTTSITVANVDPNIDNTVASYVYVSGSTYQFNITLTFTDPGPSDVWHVQVDWDDDPVTPAYFVQGVDVVTYGPGNTAFTSGPTATGTPGQYTVQVSKQFDIFVSYGVFFTVKLRDEDGTFGAISCPPSGTYSGGQCTTPVLTFNSAPTNTQITSITPAPSNEGQLVTMSGSFTDPDPSDTHTVVVNWGDGTGNQNISVAAGVVTFSATHTYADGANPSTTYQAQVISNTDSGSNTDASLPGPQVPHVVDNVAPSAVVVTPSSTSINENSSVTVSGSFTDPGTADTHTVDVDWGDGSTHTTLNLAAGVTTYGPTGSHTYLNNSVNTSSSNYTITVTVTDKDTATASNTASVTVNNVAPSITVFNVVQPQYPGNTGSINATFTDPGTLDFHDVTISWGDGSPNTTLHLNAGTFTTGTLSHTFAAGGPYAAVFTLSDDDPSPANGTVTQNQTFYVPDFTITGGTTSTVNAGGTGQYTISLGSVDAVNAPFNQNVALSCTAGLPAGTSCSFAAPTVVPAGGVSTAMSITTTPIAQPIITPLASLLPFTGMGLFGLVLVSIGRKLKSGRMAFILGTLLLVMAMVMMLPGCGASGASTTASSSGASGASTPHGTYTITVTGTFAGPPVTAHSTTVTLTVN